MKRRESIFLVVACLVVIFYAALAQQKFDWGFPLDDAWIHQTYARNLADSGEWAFVPGEASAASTAPLYTVLLAIGHLLSLPPILWAHLLGIAALTLAATMSANMAEVLFPHKKWIGIATGLATVTTWHLVWAAASGMETVLFMALGLTTFFLSFRVAEQGTYSPRHGLFLGIIGGLLTLTRPEGMVLLGLVGVGVLLSAEPNHWQRILRWGLLAGVGWLAVILPYTLWNYNLTGEVLPATASAKIAEYAPLRDNSIPQRYINLLLPVLVGAQFVLLPGFFVGAWQVIQRVRQQRHLFLLLIPLIWALTHLTIYMLRLPAGYQHGRYAMPILPVILLYGVGGMAYLVERNKRSMLGRVSTRTLALSAIAAFPAFIWLGGQAYANDTSIINTEMVKTAQWIADNLPEDELLAVHDIGALGYYAPRPILDLAGLVSPEVVPIITDKAALMTLICEQEASWLMVLPDQRPVAADDPRLTLAYESPYDLAAEARGDTREPWKMRVYAINCNP